MSVFHGSPETHVLEEHDGLSYTAWKSSTAATEVEMCDLLYGLVRFLKPALIVETGSHMGHGTMALALAVRDNGLGRIVSCEIDKNFLEKSEQRMRGCELVEFSHTHSRDLPEMKTADFVFSDSSYESRVLEYSLVKPGCFFVVHDTSEPPIAELVRSNGGTLLGRGRGCGILVKPNA